MSEILVFARVKDCRGNVFVAVADKPMTPDEWVRELSNRIDEGETVQCAEHGVAVVPMRDAGGFLREYPVLFKDPVIIDYITGHTA